MIASRLRARHSSHRTSGATRNPAKKWVASASAEKTAHQTMLRLDGSRSARMNHRNDAAVSVISSMYARASCEYQIRNGLKAANAAAITPARRETRSRPPRYAIGTTAIPASADSERNAASPVPRTCAHAQAMMKYNGGVVSVFATVVSIALKRR